MNLIKKILYSTIYITLSYGDFNMTEMDIYHSNISDWLVDASNSIDNYFIEKNGTVDSKTYAELKTSFALESRQRDSEYAIRLRLRINLPRIQDKLRIIFEDVDSDDDFYDSTKLDSNLHISDKDYSLRVEYFNYIINKLSFSMSGGVRFRKIDIYPFINIKTKYKIDNLDGNDRVLSNRFRYYTNKDIEDIVSYNILYPVEESIYCRVSNSFRYRNWQDCQQIANSFSCVKNIQENRYLSIGVSLLSELEDIDLRVQYPILYWRYRGKFYKNWIYYELSPSVLWRRESEYKTSYRFMVNFGAVFKKN